MGAENQLFKRLIHSVGNLMPELSERRANQTSLSLRPMATRKNPDTATPQDKFAEWIKSGINTHFQAATEAILSGQCPPNLTQLKKRHHMSHPVAKAYLAELERQGFLSRNNQGRYQLNRHSHGVEQGFKKLVKRYQTNA